MVSTQFFEKKHWFNSMKSNFKNKDKLLKVVIRLTKMNQKHYSA